MFPTVKTFAIENSAKRIILIFLYYFSLTTALSGQEYYKVIPTSAYPLSSLRSSVVIGQRLMSSGTHVAFQAYHGRPGRTNSYYGFYSALGELVSWHELPDLNNIPFKNVYFFDSSYVYDYYTSQDTFALYSASYSGTINWGTKIFGIYDSYSYHKKNPDSLFALDTNGYYSLIDLKNGGKTAKWRADSLFSRIEATLSIDTLISLNRVGVTDSVEYYEASGIKLGSFEKYLVSYLLSCHCWNFVTPLNLKQLIIQDAGPLIFSQWPIQLLGDSMKSDLMILNSSLDTLWNKTITEPALLKKDSTFTITPRSISLNAGGYYLLETRRSRRSNESFIQNQYQIGVNYEVLDSTFNQVLNLTIWPKDTIGRVIDEFYSSNDFVESRSKFYLDSTKALTVIISRDQQGLGNPLLMIHRTGKNGISFLNQQITRINKLVLEVFPNPCNEAIIIYGGEQEKYTAEIFSMDGQKLLEKTGASGAKLSISELVPGRYILHVTESDGTRFQPSILIKN